MSLLRITSFRAAFAFTLIVVLLVGLVLGLVMQRFAGQLTLSQERQIWREAASLSRIYEQEGTRALAAAVTANATSGQGRVLRLSSGLGAFVAGNLTALPVPTTMHEVDGWVRFEVDAQPVRARFMRFDDDVLLLIGYDESDAVRSAATMRNTLLAALVGLTALGLLGGLWLARRAQARVQAMNAHLQPVMQGALERRLPIDAPDEFGQMAEHINALLARIEQLVGATRQVSDNLAHDLRSPLTRLKMRLERLADTKDTALSEELDKALGDIDGLLRSFSALLSLSRLDSGVARLQRAAVDLEALVHDMHELFEAVFAEADMRLMVKAEPVAGFLGEQQLLQQALTNLLENVLAHAAVAGSTVTLGLVDEGATVRLSVTDGGSGIAPDKQAEAQQRFVRLDASRSSDGSGLGLSLAKAIAAHHGGTLELADAKPGLIVTLCLPKQATG